MNTGLSLETTEKIQRTLSRFVEIEKPFYMAHVLKGITRQAQTLT